MESQVKTKSFQQIRLSDINFTLWEPLENVKERLNFTWKIDNLDKIKEIDLDQLVKELDSVEKVELKREYGTYWWIFVLTSPVIILAIIMGCLFKRRQNRKHKKGNKLIRYKSRNRIDRDTGLSMSGEVVEMSEKIAPMLSTPTPKQRTTPIATSTSVPVDQCNTAEQCMYEPESSTELEKMETDDIEDIIIATATANAAGSSRRQKRQREHTTAGEDFEPVVKRVFPVKLSELE